VDAQIEASDFGGRTALILAAHYGRETIVRILLDRRANIEARDSEHKSTPLVHAAAKGYPAIVETLLLAGADVGARFEFQGTALMVAAENDRRTVVDLLLLRGADLEACNDVGYNALLLAVGRGHVEIAELLLARGADGNVRNVSRETVFELAAGKTRMLQMLSDRVKPEDARD